MEDLSIYEKDSASTEIPHSRRASACAIVTARPSLSSKDGTRGPFPTPSPSSPEGTCSSAARHQKQPRKL